MTEFRWDDPFFLDDQLTEDEQLIEILHDYAQGINVQGTYS